MRKKLMAEFSYKDAAYDVAAIKRKFWRSKGENAVKALKKNGFDAYYAEDCEAAAVLLLSLIPEGALIGLGDSHTVYALDLEAGLSEKGCQVIPNVAALNLHGYNSTAEYGYIKAPSREEARQLLADYLTSDVFLLGANAVTMKGEIINVDGVGNRIAGSLYGADRIVIVAGVNKLVPDEKAGRERIQFIAAPMNNIKYGDTCPCVQTGVCHGCALPERICNITTVMHKKPIESDFHVIIVGEELGF
ncbi:MAG: lactate utilization protein [Emergencia sp.]|nr:lactate utilization protein [Emergencia sp.]